MLADILALLYVGCGVATIVPFARYHRGEDKEKLRKNRYHNMDSPLWHGFMGWLTSLAWPITGIIFGTAYLLKADDRKELAAKQKEMDLAEAFKIVEAQRQAERTKQQRELDAFEDILNPKPKPKSYVNGWNRGRDY